jgi:hypothetical protein
MGDTRANAAGAAEDGPTATLAMVPDCFAPATTIYRWFMRLREDGVFETINQQSSYARPRTGWAAGEPVGGRD